MLEHQNWKLPYTPNPAFRKKVAYFSMEFAVHQALKIYSGGLGFLAGSHMRSAYDLKQNVIGIGMLWRFGYYDQVRDDHGYMGVQFQKKFYTILQKTDIAFSISIDGEEVKVQTYYLPPDVFHAAPLFLMTTDFPENSDKARAYSNKLYDNYPENRIAQHILLGVGGSKVVEKLGGVDVYHMNEGHALPLCFYLFSQSKNIDEVRNKVVFTTHTPERAGNEEQNIDFLQRMNFFSEVPMEIVRKITHTEGDTLSYTPAALYMSKISNGVSKLHGVVSREMWKQHKGTCEITHITNAQNKRFWADKQYDRAFINRDTEEMVVLKKEMKRELFEVVANQTGKMFDPNVLTIVWARRFASYKRANLIMRNKERFLTMLNNKKYPVQIIWAGKPYPTDHGAVSMFNDLISYTHGRDNCAVLVGYEILLSYLLKRGADVWLNTPRRPHEASGTSGMTAAMNGALNVSISDGWIPEFAKHGENSFVTPVADHTKLTIEEIDNYDHENIMQVLEKEVIPLYYEDRAKWQKIISNSMHDIYPFFDSDRMATEYYQKIYNVEYNPVENLIKSALEGEE
ncbi:MAG: alpha-glucan family phosphorylase [Chitinophagales bacterium]